MKITFLNLNYFYFIKKFLKLFLFLILFNFLIIVNFSHANTNLLGPTGLIYTPTAYVSHGIGYYKVLDNKFTKFNFSLVDNTLEFGIIRDKLADDYSLNFKLPLFLETDFLPQISIGIYNYKNKLFDSTKYLVLSKSLTSGLILHLGYKQKGNIKDLNGLINYQSIQSLITNNTNNTFYAIEYSFFPMISLMSEYFDKSINAGIRFRPLPFLAIDYNKLDLKNERNLNTKTVINFNFILSF